jgi:hypothetical protein
MSDKELVERLLDFDKVTVGDARDAALRIKALTKERDEAMQLLQTLSNMNGDLSRDMYKTKLLLAQAVEALRDLTNAFAKKVDVDQTRWKTPYEHPLSAYDRAVAFLKGNKR